MKSMEASLGVGMGDFTVRVEQIDGCDSFVIEVGPIAPPALVTFM